jgi:hypothetical protein
VTGAALLVEQALAAAGIAGLRESLRSSQACHQG